MPISLSRSVFSMIIACSLKKDLVLLNARRQRASAHQGHVQNLPYSDGSADHDTVRQDHLCQIRKQESCRIAPELGRYESGSSAVTGKMILTSATPSRH
jgi:hypothetical protein